MRNRLRVIFKGIELNDIVALCMLIVLFLFFAINQALTFTNLELQRIDRGAKGYVSDEVWYVSAARNIVRLVFGLSVYNPRCPSCATLVFTSFDNVSTAITLSRAFEDLKVVDTSYTKIPAIYVNGSRSSIELLAKLTKAKVIWGWRLADAENIDTYLNLEHPPMMKYLIALSMLVLGDYPLYWRIPSIVLGLIMVLTTYFMAKRILRSCIWALLASALVAVDPLTRIMSSLALLDIASASIGLLALYYAVKKRFKLALIVLAIATTMKFTALLYIVPILLLMARTLLVDNRSPLDVFFWCVIALLITMILFGAFQILVSIPLILYIGFSSWISNSIWGAISWHLSAKCVGPNCPVSSTPWEWFFGVNSFPVYVLENGRTIAAIGFVPIYIVTFVFMILGIFIKDQIKSAWLCLVGTFLGFVLLWLAGAKTQYSFYAIHLTPLIYIYFVGVLRFIANRENISILFRRIAMCIVFIGGIVKKVLVE